MVDLSAGLKVVRIFERDWTFPFRANAGEPQDSNSSTSFINSGPRDLADDGNTDDRDEGEAVDTGDVVDGGLSLRRNKDVERLRCLRHR